MSSSNNTPNLTQTSLNDAYQFNTFSEFIKNAKTRFSQNCVFCPSKESISLIADGSFRQCKICRKQFGAKIIPL